MGGATGYSLGDAVFGLNDWFAEGATAEFCVTKPSNLSLKPSSLSHVEAASAPIGSLTAWQGLHLHAVRESDVAARYGGEELALILPDTHSAAAADLAERVRAAVESLGLTHTVNPEGGGFVTVSIGVATALSRDGETIAMPEGLLFSADLALYKAKHEGRNRTATTLLVAPSLF